MIAPASEPDTATAEPTSPPITQPEEQPMTSPQQRPSRTRRLPKRYDVLSLYLLATLLGHVRSDFLSSEGVYFTKELPVTYSNSEWMISTEVTFAHMNEDIRVLRNYLQQRTWLDSNATESINQYVRSGSEEKPKCQKSTPTPNSHTTTNERLSPHVKPIGRQITINHKFYSRRITTHSNGFP